MENASNVVLFRNIISKKYSDIKLLVSDNSGLIKKKNYNKNPDGYSDLFQSGKIPLEVITYLYSKGQDFRYILTQVYRGVNKYKKTGVPPYSEVCLNYLRQICVHPYSDETVALESLSRLIDKNKVSKDKPQEKLQKLFRLHLLGFVSSIYFFDNSKVFFKMSSLEISLMMAAVIVKDLPKNKISEILLQTTYNKKSSEVIMNLSTMLNMSVAESRLLNNEYRQLIKQSERGDISSPEENRYKVLFLLKIIKEALLVEQNFHNEVEDHSALFLDLAN